MKSQPFNDPESVQLFEQNFMLAIWKEKLTTLLKPQGSKSSVLMFKFITRPYYKRFSKDSETICDADVNFLVVIYF